MEQTTQKLDVYLEIGQKKTFAGAVEWPGWVRSGREEASALQSLLDYAPRYARVLESQGIDFRPPREISTFRVVERLPGSSTTDFGAPAAAPASDSRAVNEAELARLEGILKACWVAFDQASSQAAGRELRHGPRGGGRDLPAITQHVLDAEEAYFSKLGLQIKNGNPHEDLDRRRQVILAGLALAARGEIPAQGPRGGDHWSLRYFVRRTAWHVLDHAWEIEDRLLD